MWNSKFWKDATERVIRTAAQAAIGALGTTAVIQEVDWRIVGGTTAVAAITSLLMAIAAGSTGNPDSASFQEDVKP